MESARITQWLSELAEQLPSLITMLVCIVLMIARSKRHPVVSLLAVIGLLLLLLHGPVFALLYLRAPALFLKTDYMSDDVRNLFLVLGFIFNSTRAIAFAPLLAAIFIGRPREKANL